MKKILLIIIIAILIFSNTSSSTSTIRLRVIANSNSEYDQIIKNKVKEIVYKDLSNVLELSDTEKEVEEKIIGSLDLLENNISSFLESEKYDLGYNINYGLNYFPEKEYNGKVYEEGEYKSLVVTLGNGEGNNWWCILFPPLCLIEAEESEENVEYDYFFKKIINIFNK